ncbi:hypothetical protein C9A42_14925 [Salmonella enterica]|nr:hypothetical protein [Salmonella enterica]EBI8647648.1 hypothetical protein [Salmonella enterica]
MAKLPRRKCKVCREWFSPAYSNVVWCCPERDSTILRLSQILMSLII